MHLLPSSMIIFYSEYVHMPLTLYVHIVVIIGSTKVLLASFFSSMTFLHVQDVFGWCPDTSWCWVYT
jgi:hypothetical protein